MAGAIEQVIKKGKKKWVIKEHPKKAPLNDLSPAEEAAQE